MCVVCCLLDLFADNNVLLVGVVRCVSSSVCCLLLFGLLRVCRVWLFDVACCVPITVCCLLFRCM